MNPELRKPDESMEYEFILFNEAWQAHGEKLVPYAAGRKGYADLMFNEVLVLAGERGMRRVLIHAIRDIQGQRK